MTLKKEFIQSLQDAGMSVRYEESTNNVHLANGQLIPFEKFLVTVDNLGSIPGLVVYKDANGKLAWKWERDTSGLFDVTLDYIGPTPVTANIAQNLIWDRFHPEASKPDGTLLNEAADPPAWTPFYVADTLVAGTIDLTIKTAVAGEDVEAILLGCGQATVTDNATAVTNILDWEDDDASAPAAGSSYSFLFKHDATNSHFIGCPTQNLTPHACWGLSNTAQGLQIEWTQVGGAGTENVWISGIYRVH